MESSSSNQDDKFESDIVELSRETGALSIQDNPTSPKICTSYSKYGQCRFGRNCKFVHRQKKGGPNEFIHNKYLKHEYGKTKNVRKEIEISGRKETVNGKQPNLGISNDAHRDFRLERPCRYFIAGCCSKDEACKFSHSYKNYNFIFPKLLAASNSVGLPSYPRKKKKSVPICYYFKRGSCSKGDDCKYYHDQRFSDRPNSSGTYQQTGSLEKVNLISSEIFQDTISHNTISNENLPCASSFNNVATDVIPGVSTSHNAHFNENKYPLSSSDYSIESSISPRDFNNTSDVPLKISNENSHTFNESYLCDVSSIHLLPKVENKIPSKALKIFDLPLSEKEILQLRETEISQLRKRYPGLEVNRENTVFTFEFCPSDPDWSHDVTNFQLQTMFPENYPVEVCRINVLQSTDIISEIILRHLDENIFDWLNQRHAQSMQVNKVELLFRPFLRWFDKNLEELFCCGLQKEQQDVLDDTDDSKTSDEQPFLSGELDADDFEIFQKDASLPENLDKTTSQVQQTSETYQANSSGLIKSAVPTYAAQKFGVNILFMGLELIEGVAAISCTKLAITLHCARCKTSSNIKTVPNKNNSITCSKCSKIMQCNFNPSILHQFTNVLGTVYLVECLGVDVNLVDCAFLVDCLSCSKQVSIQGIHYGPKQKFWCMFCNQKLVLGIESSKFQSSSVTYTNVKTVPVKKIEKKKDPSIKEGVPLPQLGACKHYKKSNRWFRFPCCGRVYPCDLCHEEKESDHEMKFASRMICGFCSKEQPYSSDKPCSGCSSNVTAKTGSHWEGGKGCRNKIKMARDDKKKYAGSSKTVSKKSQNSGKKKK